MHVIGDFAGVDVSVAFHVGDAHGAAAAVVFAENGAVQLMICHASHLAVRAVLVGVTVGLVIIVLDTNDAFELVVGIAHHVTITILHSFQRTVMITSSIVVHIAGEQLIAHLDRRAAIPGIILEGVLHVGIRVVRRAVTNFSQLVIRIGVN